MAKERAESPADAESPRVLAIVSRAHGLAVILQKDEVPFRAYLTKAVEVIGSPEEIDREDRSGPRRYRLLDCVQIHIQRIQVHIHKVEPKAILVQGVICRAPRDTWDDDFLPRLECIVPVPHGGNGQQIGRRPGVHHHCMPSAEVIGELLLELLHPRAHGISAGPQYAADGLDLAMVPG